MSPHRHGRDADRHVHGHSGHLHGTARSGRSLLTGAVLNVLITVAEAIGGLISGSLALVSDALHNFSDAAGLVIAWISARIAGRPADSRRTFGYRRAEIIGALINAVLLLCVAVFLTESAVNRFVKPESIRTDPMIPIAVFCLAGNLATAFLLAFRADRTLNVRAALAHIVSDSMASVAVIVAALVIHWTGWTRIDPLLAVAIAAYASVQAIVLLRDTVNILMQGTPKGLDLGRLRHELTRTRGVTEIHHVHAWSLGENDVFFEAHIGVGAKGLKNIEAIKKDIKELLLDRFGIRHSTLEFESGRGPGCDECLPEKPAHDHHTKPPGRRISRPRTI